MMVPSPSRRAEAVLSRRALRANLSLIQKNLSPGCGVLAVVKADAYGHGAIEASRVLQKAGVSAFGLATLEEAFQLKRAGIQGDLLVLGPVDVKFLKEAAQAGIAVSAWSSAYLNDAAKATRRASRRLKVHIKVDSGMGRLGFGMKQVPSMLKGLENGRWNTLSFESAYTQFAGADAKSLSGSRTQLVRFLDPEWPESLRLHACNSAAALRLHEAHLSWVRPGIFLYGAMNPVIHPLGKKQKPVLRLQAPVVRVHEVSKGQGVSYGPAWRAKRKTKVAVVALGYADGVPRSLGNKGKVLIGGQSCQILGRVCMDLFVADVSKVPRLAREATATLIGKQGKRAVSVHDWAAIDKTISYEILTRISARVPRRWVD